MEYYVQSNLSHDGKRYQKGDTISLKDAQAKPLLEMGVISTEAAAPATPEIEAPEAPTQQPEVAGKALDTGEPSIDGREPVRTADNAKDITPPVDTGMRALSPDVRADAKPAPAKPRRGRKVTEKPVEPEHDPSANL